MASYLPYSKTESSLLFLVWIARPKKAPHTQGPTELQGAYTLFSNPSYLVLKCIEKLLTAAEDFLVYFSLSVPQVFKLSRNP